jgi:hypothetical protein
MIETKVLVIVNDKNVESVEKCLEKLSEKFRGKVYLVFMRDVDYYPAEILLEVEKSYENIKEEGMNILNRVSEKAKSLGFDVEVLGVYCGIASERVKYMDKSIKPDILVDLNG